MDEAKDVAKYLSVVFLIVLFVGFLLARNLIATSRAEGYEEGYEKGYDDAYDEYSLPENAVVVENPYWIGYLYGVHDYHFGEKSNILDLSEEMMEDGTVFSDGYHDGLSDAE